ncbi:transcription/translation regulatory transformer protein RfaH [Seongchinamella unica]|uniref:Transcription/translation regulatory transformer protein RfaH n=1 Tax=Seongchinamella unica TaxID=2547392 RepID=A0A4R5LQX0_9GAMM|nr:transcription/translation regulatory transformer protein RfaH [Seongchinamella unica]TDG12895.1 transcription/translation regulatory transformer protein RfaH [Seongchinamella unica]
MQQWYAVQSKPRQEAVALEQLQRQDYSAYLPRIRLKKRRRNRWVEVTEPLFPRYLFIQVDTGVQSLAPVRSTVGVAGLVRFGQLLRPVPDAVIDYLRAAEDAATGERDDTAWPHRPGDKLQVLDGPFAGLPAVYQQADGEQRALLLIELLGRVTEISLPMDALGASTG